MAIRLLRESSETPNITNKDDVRMIRYAYGGYDGVVKNYGDELAASVIGSSLHIGSGRVVLNGWEVDIDGAGVTIDLSSMSSGVYYYTAYLEVNAELETAEIKTLYDTSTYPIIDTGDDLTEVKSGIAKIVLYRFSLENGLIVGLQKDALILPYTKDIYEDLSKIYPDLSEGIVVPKHAKTLLYDGLEYGRRLHHSYSERSKKITPEVQSVMLGFQYGSNFDRRMFVVEIERYASSVYGYTYIGKYRTTPFDVRTWTYGNVTGNPRFTFDIGDGYSVSFYRAGSGLFYQLSGGDTSNTSDNLYISAVYEEL